MVQEYGRGEGRKKCWWQKEKNVFVMFELHRNVVQLRNRENVCGKVAYER